MTDVHRRYLFNSLQVLMNLFTLIVCAMFGICIMCADALRKIECACLVRS